MVIYYGPRAEMRLTGSSGIVDNQAAFAVQVGRGTRNVDGAAHPHDSVGVGGGEDALVAHVEDGPALDNVPVGGDIVACKVAHGVAAAIRIVGFGLRPLVAEATIVCLVHGIPAVVAAAHALGGLFPLAAEVVDVPRGEGLCSVLRFCHLPVMLG